MNANELGVSSPSMPCHLSSQWLIAKDGHRIQVDVSFDPDSCHSNIIILPIGVTAESLWPMIWQLRQWSSVYVIYSRFVLDVTIRMLTDEAIDASAHARDLISLMDHFALSRAGLFGYCTGALIAVRAAFLVGNRFSALVCCNGVFETSRRTVYEREFDDIIKSCVRRPRIASMVRDILVAKVDVNQEFYEYTTIALRDAETFYKYVMCLNAVYEEGLSGLGNPVNTPALLIASAEDNIASAQNSAVALAFLSQAELLILDGEDHYLPCRAGTPAIAAIDNFLRLQAINLLTESLSKKESAHG